MALYRRPIAVKNCTEQESGIHLRELEIWYYLADEQGYHECYEGPSGEAHGCVVEQHAQEERFKEPYTIDEVVAVDAVAEGQAEQCGKQACHNSGDEELTAFPEEEFPDREPAKRGGEEARHGHEQRHVERVDEAIGRLLDGRGRN